MKKQILIVDDDQCMLDALRRVLHEQSDDWSMTFVRHPETAWERLLEATYDAVVTDVKMPGVNGLDLLDRIRRTDKTKDVPVVVLTGLNDNALKARALDLGAVDLLNKPVEASDLIARLRNVLRMKAYEDGLRATNHSMAERISEQDADLTHSRMNVVCRLGTAAESRDEDTGRHVVRVACYSRAVAAAMQMPPPLLDMLLLAAPLHDVGKIGIPDSVLLNPGPLSDDQWAVMRRHCEIGHRILLQESKVVAPLLDRYAVESHSREDGATNHDPLLDMAASIALTHHEKWDGSGYPRGLAGEAIPLESRVVAIADVFDALTSNRPYRPARPKEEALTIVEAMAGSHFDPRVHAAFLQALPEIRDIRARFDDDVVATSSTEGVLV